MFVIDRWSFNRHAREFAHSGVTYFENLIDPEKFAGLAAQVDALLNSRSKRRDFAMAETHHSLRRMSIVDGHTLLDIGFFAALYSDRGLRSLLNRITATKVTPCDNKIESIIVTSLSKIGDTHGWHTDDYPYALIVGIQSPAAEVGGNVEFFDYRGRFRTVHLKTGDAYLMRTDRIRHRVAPILRHDATRTILNLTYSIQGLRVIPNGTAEKLLA